MHIARLAVVHSKNSITVKLDGMFDGALRYGWLWRHRASSQRAGSASEGSACVGF
jgi:hypothetical protein